MWNFVVVWSSTFFIVNRKDKSDGLLASHKLTKLICSEYIRMCENV